MTRSLYNSVLFTAHCNLEPVSNERKINLNKLYLAKVKWSALTWKTRGRQFDSASGHKLLNKLKYKIKNKELSKYFIWKLNEFRKSPLTELKLNFYKYNLYNCGDDFKKYLEIKFKILKLKKSDINEHLETLSKYASTTQTILETGVRGVVSSWALIHGLYNNKSSEKSIFLNESFSIMSTPSPLEKMNPSHFVAEKRFYQMYFLTFLTRKSSPSNT